MKLSMQKGPVRNTDDKSCLDIAPIRIIKCSGIKKNDESDEDSEEEEVIDQERK